MLASHGGRAAARHASHLRPPQPGGPPSASRGIHIPAPLRVQPRLPAPGTAQRLFSKTRTLLTEFFNHLTAPGFRIPDSTHATPSLQRARITPIQHGFSFPARVALSRPVQPLFFPRPPAVPRTVSQVGLGTARNFTTGRPIFQNLVENVPIVGRAFNEADWEIKMPKQELKGKRPSKAKSQESQATKEMQKPIRRPLAGKENILSSDDKDIDIELDKFFPTRAVPDVTTCLLVPLTPTRTTRIPLSERHLNDTSLLPLSELASTHIAYETHSLCVSSLFSRLDAANVWVHGARCSAFSHGGVDGICTMLKVEFVGWTKAEVRGIIGESGSGWCVLEEYESSSGTKPYVSDDDEGDAFSDDTLSLFSHPFDESETEDVDPAQSLRLPTLDFSLSQPLRSLPSSPPSFASSVHYEPDPDFDPWLDSESSSEGSGSWVHPSSYL